MAETTMTRSTGGPDSGRQLQGSGRTGWFSGRRGRKRQEAVLAYLLLLPAFTIIFTFGLFPLAFAIYESTLKGLNKIVGTYTGLGNYVRAVDNLAYVIAFWVAVVLFFLAVQKLGEVARKGADHGESPWAFLAPAPVLALGLALFTRFVFTLLPEALGIPTKVPRGEELTRQLLAQLFGEAWRLEAVASSFRMAVVALAAAAFLIWLTPRLRKGTRRDGDYFGGILQASLMIIGGLALSWLTWTEIQAAYTAALEEGVTLSIWNQVITISAGLVLLGLSWLLWRSASFRTSNVSTFLRLGAAAALAVGAWVLIGELPVVIAEGNKDWYQGLVATVYYSIGSIPLQLTISLMLATFMYQNIRFTTMWRMIYFLPYIAPVVGTASVFRIIFSGRAVGPINSLLAKVGVAPLGWLNEPAGIFQMMVGDAVKLPTWASGPSLALGVIILYGVWSFVGFNIVIFLAGLGNIPRTLYEAAAIDGGNRWDEFRHITLPMLSPSIYFLVLLSVIGTFKAFNHIWVLRLGAALGTTDTASVVIFRAFNRDTRYGYASALAILLLIIVVILTVINNRVASKRVFYG